ncbi:response regulator transcription factor [Azospirillum soli]|uniref:response regulator transcription factor n=1 Tax=Azospirillum soli TaxID=1304799 RepID=UPI001AE59210|nr:response regulator transcription factor [Azospirillum soli]MBP2316293.1 DNA-binding NarL/FixJ family response regulator [Azospirillum soli]
MPERKKILCIEDDADTRDLLIEELEEAGFQVDGFGDGASALAALASDRPDLILCDIDLPELSGLEILRSIPEIGPAFRAIPFIFLTAYGQRENVIAARRLGCDEYIVKPIDFELLIETIQNRIARSAGRAVPVTNVHLTDREVEVLTWSARGKSSTDIAVLLKVSERTVNFHVDNAIRKLDVATRIQAAVKAALLGLIVP